MKIRHFCLFCRYPCNNFWIQTSNFILFFLCNWRNQTYLLKPKQTCIKWLLTCALKGKLCCTDCTRIMQGFGYNQKFHDKRGFCNLANSRTSQFMFSKYLTEYQNVKIVKSKFKSEKSNQKQTKAT